MMIIIQLNKITPSYLGGWGPPMPSWSVCGFSKGLSSLDYRGRCGYMSTTPRSTLDLDVQIASACMEMSQPMKSSHERLHGAAIQEPVHAVAHDWTSSAGTSPCTQTSESRVDRGEWRRRHIPAPPPCILSRTRAQTRKT